MLACILVASVAAGGTYFALKSSNSQPVVQPPQQATTPANTDEIAPIISYVKAKLPSVATSESQNFAPPHRMMSAPYNFYAVGTAKQEWQVSSQKISDLTKATTITKTIYDYLKTDLHATAETVAGDSSVATISNTTTDMNYYRFTTTGYTCGLVEITTTATTTPYGIDGATISVACSTASEYQKNAELQKPFYAAFITSKNYSADMTLNLPSVKKSNTNGYNTAQVGISSDGAFVGGAVGLFYQTPDNTWHFFIGTQQELNCNAYDTADLKKAFAGEQCFDPSTNKQSTLQAS